MSTPESTNGARSFTEELLDAIEIVSVAGWVEVGGVVTVDSIARSGRTRPWP